MESILELVDKYWKFDESQQPISSWHDKQDLLKKIESILELKEGKREMELLIDFSKRLDKLYDNNQTPYQFQIMEIFTNSINNSEG